MRALFLGGAALAVAAPPMGLLLLVRRYAGVKRQLPLLVSAFATGLVAAVFAAVLERMVLRAVEIDPLGRNGSLTLAFYTFAVSAPLEMALTAAVVAPYWRIRRSSRSERWTHRPTERDGMLFAASATLGFSSLRHMVLGWHAQGGIDVVRIFLAGVGFPLLASLWGYMLGRDPDRGLRAKNIGPVWAGSTVFLAVLDELLFHRGTQALLAAGPLLLCAVVAAAFLWRDPLAVVETPGSARFSLFLSAPAPSLGAIRDAFRREERPLTLRWLSFGVLVNAGVVLTGVVVAVLLGRRFGLDFAAVDRPDSVHGTIAPVGLLALGVLSAFPIAGYLMARASSARSVLEPALSSALAIFVLLVFFGVIAPAALVFGLAVSPIAFVFACAGAWFGTAR